MGDLEGAGELTLGQLTGDPGGQEGTGPAGSQAGAPDISGAPSTQPAKPLADGTSTDKAVPYHRLAETEARLKEASLKLSELEKFKSQNESVIQWVQYMKDNPKVGQAVMDAYDRARMSSDDPSLSNLPEDDPLKPVMMKMAAMERDLKAVRADREKEIRDRTSQDELNKAIKQVQTDYETLYTRTKDVTIQAMLKSDFHRENILLRYAKPENESKSLEQVATEYLSKVPNVRVSTSYIKSKDAPVLGTRGGGSPSTSAPDTSKLTLDDVEELDKIMAAKIKAANSQ